jgi:16S rRNA (uracil1498-N3)-methyltransferase
VNLFFEPNISQGVHYLDQTESHHAVKVLRKKTGDRIRITDGKGFFYDAVIVSADARHCSFELDSKIQVPQPEFSIHIAISPTKNADRIEWFVEKAVEIGVQEISLIDCDHTERRHIKTDRLEKMATSAMKQSLKAYLPVVHPLIPLRDFIASASADQKFIAHVDTENKAHLQNSAQGKNSYVILIGPEGDFSNEELTLAETYEFKKVTLGPSRLRTETAGLVACHILNLANT